MSSRPPIYHMYKGLGTWRPHLSDYFGFAVVRYRKIGSFSHSPLQNIAWNFERLFYKGLDLAFLQVAKVSDNYDCHLVWCIPSLVKLFYCGWSHFPYHGLQPYWKSLRVLGAFKQELPILSSGSALSVFSAPPLVQDCSTLSFKIFWRAPVSLCAQLVNSFRDGRPRHRCPAQYIYTRVRYLMKNANSRRTFSDFSNTPGESVGTSSS